MCDSALQVCSHYQHPATLQNNGLESLPNENLQAFGGKSGRTESEVSFQFHDNYPSYTDTELLIEFINLLRGRMKKDAYEFLIKNSGHQITIDAAPIHGDFTYSVNDLKAMQKFVNLRLDNCELEDLMKDLNAFDMNLIDKSDPMSLTTTQVSDAPFQPITSQESINNDNPYIDVKEKIEGALMSHFNKAAANVTSYMFALICNGLWWHGWCVHSYTCMYSFELKFYPPPCPPQ